jgi:hypothetical protein
VSHTSSSSVIARNFWREAAFCYYYIRYMRGEEIGHTSVRKSYHVGRVGTLIILRDLACI